MRLIAVLAAVMVALAAAGVAGAYPTLSGPTGLLTVPTTDTAPERSLEAAGDWANLSADGNGFVVRGLLGATERVELGALYAHFSEPSGRILGINGKLQLRSEPESTFGLAVGANATDPGGDRFGDNSSGVQLYAVASKDLTSRAADLASVAWRMRVNAGLMYDSAEDDTALRPFVGLDFTQPDGGQLMLEYQARSGRDVSSIGLRYPLAAQLTVQAGITNAFEDSHQLVLGAAYRWGLGIPGL